MGLEASLCDIMSSGVLNAWNDCTNKQTQIHIRAVSEGQLSVSAHCNAG